MIKTDRLVLRQWKETDYLPFVKMGLDPDVMRYFYELLTPQKSLEMAKKIHELIQQNGWGFWAVELKETGEFIGFIGLHSQPTLFELSPCIEIGWRISKKFWRRGYAFEGARAALKYGFEELNAKKIVAFTACQNQPSEQLMMRLGMTKVMEFIHPELPTGNIYEKHVLYELDKHSFNHFFSIKVCICQYFIFPFAKGR
ncbi:GNAT family N-acetyltransferase [Acinetobacter sp. TGL-Y2]|uniref:GNAT family N-acetyltransferase n=1 Tax=Acinetobacter sp. TGL-Y2 TaxID=1407071 RepID=UPI0009D77B57|nr:GNAT family N-acetyltransferase [Acinetobacter sp. TGL-Y2]